MKTTNYYQTFIEVAEDCPVEQAEIPQLYRGKRTIALQQFEMIKQNPYVYTSDDVIFGIYAWKNNIAISDPVLRKNFFSRGRACMRTSPLGKRYGWGIHFDCEGKMALYGKETTAYHRLKNDSLLDHVRAIRSHKK